MPVQNPSDRELFPLLFMNGRSSRSADAYEASIEAALEEIADRRGRAVGKKTSQRDLSYSRRTFEQQAWEAWQPVNARLEQEVLGGTVDGFPKLWVYNGRGMLLNGPEKDDGSDPETLDTLEYAVDYFACAERSRREYATDSSLLRALESGEGPRFVLDFRVLRAATEKAGIPSSFLLKMLIRVLLGVAVIVGLLRFRQELLDFGAGLSPEPSIVRYALIAAGIVAAAYVLRCSIRIVQYFQVNRDLSGTFKRISKADHLGLAQRRADAQRMLRYYQLWREDVRQRRQRGGYQILDHQGHDMVPECLERMDSLIDWMETAIQLYDRRA